MEAANNAGATKINVPWITNAINLQQPGSCLAEAVRPAYPMNSTVRVSLISIALLQEQFRGSLTEAADHQACQIFGVCFPHLVPMESCGRQKEETEYDC